MFVEMCIAAILGISAGMITGLIPGIHVNLLAVLFITYTPQLTRIFTPLQLVIVLLATALTHTLIDAIPSIYLGAPDEAHILSALPGHRLLLAGQGHTAIFLTALGGYVSFLCSLLLFPFLIPLMMLLYPIIRPYTGHLLLIVVSFMIVREKTVENKLLAIIFFSLSGILGLTIFSLPMRQPLFSLLSGLFGLSILLISLETNSVIPKQKKEVESYPLPLILKTTSSATSVGFIAAFLPGFGNSQAAITAQQIVGDIGDKGFIMLVGGINTVNFFLSLCSLFALEKARNGAVLAVQSLLPEFSLRILITAVCVLVIVASMAVVLTLSLSQFAARILGKINYRLLNILICLLLLILAFSFDGVLGLSVLIIATMLGITTTKYKLAKHHLLGCLLIPVISYFLT